MIYLSLRLPLTFTALDLLKYDNPVHMQTHKRRPVGNYMIFEGFDPDPNDELEPEEPQQVSRKKGIVALVAMYFTALIVTVIILSLFSSFVKPS
jgi:hypothetical protein